MKTSIQKAINEQINQEQSAAYIYLGMSAYFEKESLTGFAHWCKTQYEEEIAHSMRLFQYLLDRGGQVILDTIKAPRMHFNSPVEVFLTALEQEKANTQSINCMSLPRKKTIMQPSVTCNGLLMNKLKKKKTLVNVLLLLNEPVPMRMRSFI